MKRFIYITLGIFQIIISIGAVGGGLVLMISPDGNMMQLPGGLLNDSPFENYFIPGLILFAVIGLGHLFASIYTLMKKLFSGWLAIFFGNGLMIWIFMQVSFIGGGDPLQFAYFFAGLLESIFGIIILFSIYLDNITRKVPI